MKPTRCFLLLAVPLMAGQSNRPVSALLKQFEESTVFWQQFEVAEALVAAHDKTVLGKLQPWLNSVDRHSRGNAAFVFAGLGDSRGFDTIVAILEDRSERPEGQGLGTGSWSLAAQIRSDRYYAAHLLGDLKDPRGIPVLVPLLKDPDVNYIVPWSLGKIGNRAAIPPLIDSLGDPNPSIRVLAIYALADLKAAEAVPKFQQLLSDNEKSNFGNSESVAEAARAAIAKLSR